MQNSGLPSGEPLFFAGVNPDFSLSFVGAYPDILSVRFPDQFVPELRMGDGDQTLRSLPGCEPDQIHDAIFCDNIISLASRVGYDVS